MCGLNGIFAWSRAAPAVRTEELIRTRDHMANRGPDGTGLWVSDDQRVGFGHRRLSIIDLSNGGHQPMTSADGALTVVLNGEIYNYQALRAALVAKGCVFRSTSDTEVLLHLYAEKGDAMLGDLRGMFALILWDSRRRRLLMARDPYGIKPLYYSDTGGTIRFASQVKALLAGGAISREPEPAGQVGFHLWGCVPEPFTTYRDIRALPAGSALVVDENGAGAPTSFFSIASVFCEAEKRGPDPAAAADAGAFVREAVLDSVRHHLIADVPVGAFLSAGIDSGALVGLMRDAGANDIQTVTLAFDEFRGQPQDEAPLAEDIARLYGTQHVTRVVTEQEFQDDLPAILDAMDQPSIDGINSWFVAKAARELGLKVALSGVGGDELFGGYPSFRSIPAWVSRMRLPAKIPFAGRAFRTLAGWVGPQRLGLNPKSVGMIELGATYPGAYLLRRGLFMPWELEKLLDPDVVRAGLDRLSALAPATEALTPEPRSGFAKVAILESALYMRNQLLRDTDWASMAHSLEVRTPLVDSVLLETLAPYLASSLHAPGKTLLAHAPQTPLPDSVVYRPKTGFSTPIASWLKRSAFFDSQTPAPGPANAASPWARQWAVQVAGRD